MADFQPVSTAQPIYRFDGTINNNYIEFEFYYVFDAIGPIGNFTGYSVSPYLYFYVNGNDIIDGVLIDDISYQPISFIITNEEFNGYLLNGDLILTAETTSQNADMQFEFFYNAEGRYINTPSRLIDMSDYNIEEFLNGYYWENVLNTEEEVFILNQYIEEKNDIIIDLEAEIEILQSNAQAPASVFELINDAFSPVFNTLNLQVAPNITLGMLFVVPIVVGVISFIIKEFTK